MSFSLLNLESFKTIDLLYMYFMASASVFHAKIDLKRLKSDDFRERLFTK